MPEVIVIDDFEYLNVSHTVGRGGVNHPDDVIVVQAMLKLITDIHLKGVRVADRPVPTGALTKDTLRLIKTFQSTQEKLTGFKTFETGSIRKAVGGRAAHGTKRLWTIISLNYALMDAMLVLELEEKYPRVLLSKFFSSLRPVLAKIETPNRIDL